MASKKTRPLDDPPAASSSEEEEDSSEEEEEEEVPQKPQSKPHPIKQQQQPQSEEEEEDEDESEDDEEEEEKEEKREEHQQEEEESDDDEEQEQQMKKTQKENQTLPKSPPNSKKTLQPEPESDSESDSQKSPRASDFTIKPSKNAKEDKSDTPVSKPSAKRRAENNGKSPKSKKAKTEEDDDGGTIQTPATEKKSSVNRLWSEEDEIAILKGLIEFQSSGKDPSAHQQEFYESVKKSIHVDVSRAQLMDKVRRLKTKFKTNMDRSMNGKDLVFAKPHEQRSFQLSKKIWGDQVDDVGNGEKSDARKISVNEKSSSRSSKKSANDKLAIVADVNADVNANANVNADVGGSKEKDLVMEEAEKDGDDLGKLYPHLMSAFRPDYISNSSLPELVKDNLSLLESSELKEMESKWHRQNAAEMEVYLGRIDLLCEQTKMVLNAMKSNS